MKIFKLSIFTILIILSSSVLYAQDDFYSLISKGDELYRNRQYKESAETYDKAFKAGTPNALQYYNAACSWALAGDKEKAFVYLKNAVDKGWTNIEHVKLDQDLNSLHADKRWNEIITQIQKRIDIEEAGINKELRSELLQILEDDQKYRMVLDSIRNTDGIGSPEWNNLLNKMRVADSINLGKIIAIINKYGWPGKPLVGSEASLTAFLVIQHSDLQTQEKYLPMLYEAAQNGEASMSSYALLYDRVEMGNGRKQKYGTQLRLNMDTQKYELYQVEDEVNLNKRRAEVGLEPIEQYMKRFGLEYKPVK
ncbi:MAG: hypothetical protein EHM58_09420 [Ignavibacteriae bacterium]|nr:MAG: hypothetical protein EHM58_09420 [Ignavibacteriota bacterium]